ncbi:MAG: low molecular weight phosphotyrosine protein phosphatase [Muribaculaceae bacterium]|nr:low molecular weight phosphotyrosine protein phosphatase [Muribaculaceae bacterium]
MLDNKTEEYLHALRDKHKIRILFVCLGNICRSPAAEGVMQSLVDSHDESRRFCIDSAGTANYHTGELPDKRMRVHAQRRGYDLTHHARQFKVSDFDDFDLILGMDDYNLSTLRSKARDEQDERKIMAMGKFISPIYHYDHVPDPYYEGSEGFELVLDLLEDATCNLYKQLS